MLELTVQELKERLEKQELLTEEAMRIAKVAQNEIQEFKKLFIRPTNSLTNVLMLSDPPPLPEPLNYHPETPPFNKQLQSQSDFNGFPSTLTTPFQYCSPAVELSDPPPLPEPLNYHPETPPFNKQLQSQSDFNGFP